MNNELIYGVLDGSIELTDTIANELSLHTNNLHTDLADYLQARSYGRYLVNNPTVVSECLHDIAIQLATDLKTSEYAIKKEAKESKAAVKKAIRIQRMKDINEGLIEA
jgi:hypothetical protein